MTSYILNGDQITQSSLWDIILGIHLDKYLKISFSVPCFTWAQSSTRPEPSAMVFRNHQILLTVFSNIY